MTLIRADMWCDLWALIHAYWWSDEKFSARLLLFGIVGLTLGMVRALSGAASVARH